MWWLIRGGIILLAIIGVVLFFALPFPWNVFASAMLLCLSLIVPIVLLATNRTVAEAIVLVLPAIMAFGTFFGNFTTFGKAFGWVKPIYAINIEPSVIALDKESSCEAYCILCRRNNPQP